MYKERLRLYAQLEEQRKSKVIAYVTGDRRGLETQMAKDVLDLFLHHLDIIQKADSISLYLYTCGGDTQAAWSIVHLIRQFCKSFEVIVPSKAHSGGTLLCLGANSVMMTKQATLGPIDPSVNSPINPHIPGAPEEARLPVNVEMINGFINLATERLRMGEDTDLGAVLGILAQHIHPLVLGHAHRATAQIRMLAERLISHQTKSEDQINQILAFLCSDSGSHDYTMYRDEAKALGLNIVKPDDAQYATIKALYDDIAEELKLAEPYDPNLALGTAGSGQFAFTRALVESINGGSHHLVTHTLLSRKQVTLQPGVIQQIMQDQRLKEGWEYELPK